MIDVDLKEYLQEPEALYKTGRLAQFYIQEYVFSVQVSDLISLSHVHGLA